MKKSKNLILSVIVTLSLVTAQCTPAENQLIKQEVVAVLAREEDDYFRTFKLRR